jgi:hypothetical protein
VREPCGRERGEWEEIRRSGGGMNGRAVGRQSGTDSVPGVGRERKGNDGQDGKVLDDVVSRSSVSGGMLKKSKAVSSGVVGCMERRAAMEK